MSYRRLAARTGWSHGIIGEYFGGRVLPPTDRFDELVRLLEATPEEQHALAVARDRVEEEERGRSDTAEEVTPRQLPADLVGFAGREAELGDLDRLLHSTEQQPIVLSGTAGVGKTSLAVHWAHRVAGRFPDGQVFVDLRGFGRQPPLSAGEALQRVLVLLGVPVAEVPADVEGRVRTYTTMLSQKRMLVVLDNAADLPQIQPLLVDSRHSLVLVTSRVRLTAAVRRSVDLDLPKAVEAAELLARRVGSARCEREPEAVAAIVEACARLPLALAVVAARAALHPQFSLTAIASELTRGKGLDRLRSDDPKADVETVFSWSYKQLSPEAQRLFRLCGLHPGPEMSLAAAAALAERDSVEEAADELVRAHLATRTADGRAGTHDLLCAYAVKLADRCESPADRLAARTRLVDHYTHAAATAAMALNPSRDPAGVPVNCPPSPMKEDEAAAWFAAEHRALLGTVDVAVQCGADRQAWQLAWALADHLDRSGHWTDWIATQQVAVRAAARLGERTGLALAHRSMSGGYIRTGRHLTARRHLELAYGLFEELGDHAGAARCQHAIGWSLETQDRFAEAIEHDELALALFRRADDPVGQARTLNSTGWHEARLGRYEPAIGRCEEALALQRQLGDAVGMAATLDSLGYVHHQRGENGKAVERYREALLLFVEQGDRFNEADTSTRLGDAWAAAGAWVAARETWSRALALFERLGHPKAAEVRNRLIEA